MSHLHSDLDLNIVTWLSRQSFYLPVIHRSHFTAWTTIFAWCFGVETTTFRRTEIYVTQQTSTPSRWNRITKNYVTECWFSGKTKYCFSGKTYQPRAFNLFSLSSGWVTNTLTNRVSHQGNADLRYNNPSAHTNYRIFDTMFVSKR